MLLVNRPTDTGILESLYGFPHIWHLRINYDMKLKLSLLLFCLLGIGVFSNAQDKKKNTAKPKVENGADAIPVVVKSNKKAHKVPPPPPPPVVARDRKPLPPPKVEVVKFTPPKIVKDAEKPLPPPPPPAKPAKAKTGKPVTPDMPPMPDDRG